MNRPSLLAVLALVLGAPLVGCGSSNEASIDAQAVSDLGERDPDVIQDRAIGYLATGSNDKLVVKCAAVLVAEDAAIALASCVDAARDEGLRAGFGDIRGTRASEPLGLRRVKGVTRVDTGDSPAFAISVLELEPPAVGAQHVEPAVLGSPTNGSAVLITYDDARRVRSGIDDHMRVSKRVTTRTLYEHPRRVSVEDAEMGVCAEDRGAAIVEVGRGINGHTRVSGLVVERSPDAPEGCERKITAQSARVDGRVADLVKGLLQPDRLRNSGAGRD